MSTPHLSPFALDAYFSEQKSDVEIEGHLGSCESCAAYVANLRRLDGEDNKRFLRRPLQATSRVGRPGRDANARRFVAISSAVGTLALAAGFVLFLRHRQVEDTYVGIKGLPAVQVIVKSDLGTRVWDGASPVFPGDALALEVACEDMSFVTVATEDEGTRKVGRLSEGPCPKNAAPLPFTLVVDEQRGPEHFSVVMSHVHLEDDVLAASVRERTRKDGIWVTAFTFQKEFR